MYVTGVGWIDDRPADPSPRFMHVMGVGWVDTMPSEWEFDRITDPAPLPRFPHGADPGQIRAAVDERMRAWREAKNPPLEPWPAPEVAAREVAASDAPNGPARLARALTGAGWSVTVTYARGTIPNAQGRPGRVVDSWAVRARRGTCRAAALWTGETGKISSDCVLVTGDRPLVKMGLTKFKEEI